MLLSSFCDKDVVNVDNGEKLGKVRNVDINIINGKINHIIVSINQSFSNLFKNKKKLTISWDKIVKIGGEIILVDLK